MHAWLVLSALSCRTESVDPDSPTLPTTDATVPTEPGELVVTRPDNPTCNALPRAQPASSVQFEPLFEDFWVDDVILAAKQAPGDADRWYLGLRSGRVLRVGSTGATVSEEEVLDLGGALEFHLEGGLLGIAFSPNFDQDGVMYASYTTSDASRISRFVSLDGGSSFGGEQVVLEAALGYGFHFGGDLHADADGNLLWSFGDGGNFFNAQDLRHPAGSVLRIDPEGNDGLPPTGELWVRNYAIPDDNPSIPGALPEIYGYGLRNPYRITLDPLTGDVWAGDVGEDQFEEATRVVPGGNHGWPIKEGFACFLEDPCDDASLVDPVVVYGRDEGVSIIGGHVYRGSSIAGLQGAYVFSEWTTGSVWAAVTDPSSGKPVRQFLGTVPTSTLSWGQGHDGELVAAGFTLYRVVAGETPEVEFPQKLSETGCVDPDTPSEPAPGLIPYIVQMPLWSDGATKRRWMALPDGAQLTIDELGRWELPVGSVLVKEFTADGVRVETRLMMRHDDGGWGYYTYRWDDDGADATLVTTGSTVDTPGRRWTIPSRSQCVQCHTEAAADTLGLTTEQLNREADLWEVGSANQIEVFRRMTLFAEDPGPPEALPAYPTPDDAAASLRDRARAYLDVQCASCHQPDSTAPTALDLRSATPLSQTQACDEPPQDGDLGLADARVVAPGAPERSVLLERMLRLDGDRMPRVGSEVVDVQGTELIEAWIDELTGCEP